MAKFVSDCVCRVVMPVGHVDKQKLCFFLDRPGEMVLVWFIVSLLQAIATMDTLIFNMSTRFLVWLKEQPSSDQPASFLETICKFYFLPQFSIDFGEECLEW